MSALRHPPLPARQRAALAWLQPLPTRRVWHWRTAVRHAGYVLAGAGWLVACVWAWGPHLGWPCIALLAAGTGCLLVTERVETTEER